LPYPLNVIFTYLRFFITLRLKSLC